jgi:hypothetical protein
MPAIALGWHWAPKYLGIHGRAWLRKGYGGALHRWVRK